jgi:FAD:protein FMN transferase
VTVAAAPEVARRFPCFGAVGEVHASEIAGSRAVTEQTLTHVQFRLLALNRRLSRFKPDSELSQLNRDRRETVPASPLMRRFVSAALEVAELTGGLVDATLLDALEQAGYADDFDSARALPLAEAGAATASFRPAAPSASARWREIVVDDSAGTITRPPGVRLDSGGVAKGLAADLVAPLLEGHASFAVNCCGDLRIGGKARVPRRVGVDSPFGDGVLHEFEIADGGVATSGIGRRSWRGSDGGYAHHLLDPSTGLPAITGVVQATALAPTALEAEALAKAALLSGPAMGQAWLRHGGLLVLADGSFEVVPAR